jgi:protein-S-isoprenylcysteine O-methyltransferase Ste14
MMPTTTLPGTAPPNPLQHTGGGAVIITAVALLVTLGVVLFVMWGTARFRGRRFHPPWWALGAVVVLVVVAALVVAPVKGSVSSRVVRQNHLIPTPSTTTPG